MTLDSVPQTCNNEEEIDMAITVTQVIFMLIFDIEENTPFSMPRIPRFNEILTAILEQA